MIVSPLIRRILSRSLVPGICLAAIVYFAHHALFDDHGLRRLARLEAQAQARQAELDKIAAARAQKAAEVRMLSPQSLDPDLLDERARASLGLARPDEIVVFKPH